MLAPAEITTLAAMLNGWPEMQRLSFMERHHMSQFQFGMMMTILSGAGCDHAIVKELLEDLCTDGCELNVAQLGDLLGESSPSTSPTALAAAEPEPASSSAADTSQADPQERQQQGSSSRGAKAKTKKKQGSGKKTSAAQLMPEEKAIIMRLSGLGVSVPSAIKAFREAGGHEQRAANILFDWMAEGRELGATPARASPPSSTSAAAAQEDFDVFEAAPDGSFDLDDVS